jgi:regulator of nucleoside diphosphate kinase
MSRMKVLNKNDCERIKHVIEDTAIASESDRSNLRELQYCITHSRQVEPRKMRPDVVTMNSRFTLKDVGNGRTEVCSLVFPSDLNGRGTVSVLSPMGSQLLGSTVGTVIKTDSPNIRYLKIEEIQYQPEAAGHFHL